MGINTTSLIITTEMLSLIAETDEFKGAWRALGQLAPERLSALKKVASIESIGSSTRIEGSKLSDAEVETLLSNISVQQFATRDEQEVAGYSAVMNIIFESYEHIPFTINYILQLHAELLKYSEKDSWHRGQYKKSPNHVEAFDGDGKSLGIVFETASPFETPLRMDDLINRVNEAYAARTLHPLLIISIFVVEFLAVHPFQDGNGRLSRVLTIYLLLKYGYVYAPYSSLEAVIEQNKEGYYLALRQTQGTIQSGSPDWQPWVIFFLKALQKQKQRLEIKLEREQLLLGRLPALGLQILELAKSRGPITVRDTVTLTGANRNTVKKQLAALVENKQLRQHGGGKGTWYSLT
ncbi:Fic family protein [soil metagenome]